MTVENRTSALANAQLAADDDIDLSNILGTLWRGKLWIALAGFLTLIVGAWYAFAVAVPVYTTSASVVLETRKQNVMDIDSVVTGLSGDMATINTEVEVFLSRKLRKQVVEALDLLQYPEFNYTLREKPTFSLGAAVSGVRGLFGASSPPPAPPSRERLVENAVQALAGKITVSNTQRSYVFVISVTTQNPEVSALIANTLAELYIQDQIQVKFDKTEQATVWLSERVTDLQAELEAAEERLKEFSSKSNVIGPEGLAALNRQLKELRERRTQLEQDAAATVERLEAIEGALGRGDRVTVAELAQDRLLTALARDTQNTARFDERANALVARLTLERERALSQIKAVEASAIDLELRIKTQSEELVSLQQMQREAEASRLIYEAFLTRLKETTVQQGIQQADSRVLSEAVVPRVPSAPRKSRILLMSLIVGLMIGSAGVIAYEMSQNTYRVAEALEAATGHSVLAQIPAIPVRKRANLLKYVTEKPNSAASEAIRNLRTSLLLANLDKAPQVIMSTSSVPGEGKTTQSLALTHNFAHLGERVLLIEGDIRRRVFKEYFNIDKEKSYLSVLAGNATFDEVVAHNPELKADVLVGERSNVNAADLFSSERFASFLKELRGRYDRIIIDTPPVLAVPDARVIGQSVDAIIYTVKWDSTTQRQVAEGLRSLEAVNLRVSGLVLGQIDKRGMKRYGYGDSYGAYQSYYDN